MVIESLGAKLLTRNGPAPTGFRLKAHWTGATEPSHLDSAVGDGIIEGSADSAYWKPLHDCLSVIETVRLSTAVMSWTRAMYTPELVGRRGQATMVAQAGAPTWPER